MSNTKVILHGNYRHKYSHNSYHVLSIANENSKNPDYPVKIVYLDNQNKIWCNDADKFLTGMTLIDERSVSFLLFLKQSDKYPKTMERFQHQNGNIYSILYIANSHCKLKDYPIYVIYKNENNGTIWAKTLDNFRKKMTKI